MNLWLRGYAEVAGVGPGEFGQHNADLPEVQAGGFSVQLPGQATDRLLVLVLVRFLKNHPGAV